MSSNDPNAANKMWELSLYELNRKPQPAITDNTEIAINPRSLQNELMCPICLDMLKNTMTTKECLHRFCSECIITALRSGNKECPTCRKKLVSKRSLRPDPNFDLLIAKIHPNRDEYEAHQSKVLQNVHKNNSQASLVQSINEGIKLQNRTRSQRNTNKKAQAQAQAQPGNQNTPKGKNKNANSGTATQPTRDLSQIASTSRWAPPEHGAGPSSSGSSLMTARTDIESDSESDDSTFNNEVELVFKAHPKETDAALIKSLKQFSTRYLKTTNNATMAHLSKYLETRAKVDLGEDFANRQISFSVQIALNPGKFTNLRDTDTLKYVVDTYWKMARPLELYYIAKKK